MNESPIHNRPDFECALYSDMRAYWQIVDDVRQGTLHMRRCGKTYLPKHPIESNRAYQIRLDASTFFNAYEHTLQGLVGMIFRENPVFGEDVKPPIKSKDRDKEDYVENIDLRGTHFDMFARELCTDAFDGHSFLYVDMQPTPTRGENATGVPTLADVRAINQRPYWLRYRASDAKNWRTELVGGRTTLTQITFEERSYERLGAFGEELVTRYRVLRPGEWQLYREVSTANGARAMAIESEGTTDLKEIPVAVVYGKKIGHFYSRPPLIDLAHLNVSHWQLMSDYRHILHYANVPIMYRVNATPNAGGGEAIGPNRMIDVGQGGSVAFAEHHGYAIEGARKEILDIEQRMSVLGMAMIARKGEAPEATATEKLLDSAEQSSSLSVIARSLQDALEQGLYYTARYLGKDSGGSITVNKDFHGLSLDPQKLTAYATMVKDGQLSVETLWKMLEVYGELPEDFDPKAERDALQQAQENPANLPPNALVDNLTGAPLPATLGGKKQLPAGGVTPPQAQPKKTVPAEKKA